MKRIAAALVALYPQAWRARYGDELLALIEDSSISPLQLADLARGALDAHLGPAGLNARPVDRMRNTVAATLGCWIAFVIAGAGFAKSTEDFTAYHPLLGAIRVAVAVLATLSAAAVGLGGGPLILAVLAEARRNREPALVRAVATPFVAIGAVALATGWLVVAAHSHGLHGADGLLAAWLAIGIAAAAFCVFGVRSALLRSSPAVTPLRVAVRAAAGVTAAMIGVTAATLAYAIALALATPSLASSPGGPFSPSAEASVIAACAVMAAASAAAVVTTRRGWRALPNRQRTHP